MRSRCTVVIKTMLLRVVAAAGVVSASIAGCGAPATPARRAEAPARSPSTEAENRDSREWVFVEAPTWSGELTSISTPHAGSDHCITSANIRACASEGAWSDVGWGGSGELWAAGRSGDDWIFNDSNGHVLVSHGFTGALRELPQPLPSRAVGQGWDPSARITIDGILQVWSGSEL